MRYAWDEADYYLKEAKFKSGIKGWIAKNVLNYLRKWDMKSANNVKLFYRKFKSYCKKN